MKPVCNAFWGDLKKSKRPYISTRISQVFRGLLFLFGAMMAPACSFAENELQQLLNAPRVASLKKRINYDEKIARENTSEQVALDPAAMNAPSQLQSWTKKIRDSLNAEGVRVVGIEFLKGEEQIRVNLKIYDPKNNSAGINFLLKADAVSTVEINDVPGPMELGAISLMSPETPPELVYWKFRNVLAEVSIYKTSLSSLAIARWIQEELVRSVKPVPK